MNPLGQTQNHFFTKIRINSKTVYCCFILKAGHKIRQDVKDGYLELFP